MTLDATVWGLYTDGGPVEYREEWTVIWIPSAGIWSIVGGGVSAESISSPAWGSKVLTDADKNGSYIGRTDKREKTLKCLGTAG
jgi:hypothetical protein